MTLNTSLGENREVGSECLKPSTAFYAPYAYVLMKERKNAGESRSLLNLSAVASQ